MNDDEAKFLRGRVAVDGDFLTGSHCVTGLFTDLVRALETRSIRRRVVVRQTDNEVVQVTGYISLQHTVCSIDHKPTLSGVTMSSAPGSKTNGNFAHFFVNNNPGNSVIMADR